MDIINTLEIEYDTIRNTIMKYCPNDDIKNLLDKLHNEIAKKDYDTVTYCIIQIKEWYDKNYDSIKWNCFTIQDEYSCERIKNLLDGFNNENSKAIKKTNTTTVPVEPNNKNPIIFLSHNSKDKKYGDALRDFIVGLGVRDEQLIYTSHAMHGVPLNDDIYDYIRKNINKNVYMIFLLSNNYFESSACLNEMGAAWVMHSDYTNIFLPDFDLHNEKFTGCVVSSSKMSIVLNGDNICNDRMIELKDIICNMFELNISERKVFQLIQNFSNNIK